MNNLAIQSLVAAYATSKAIVDEFGARAAVADVTTVKSADVNDNGEWAATVWSGSMRVNSPYTSAGGLYYCPAQTATASLTSTPANQP